MTKVLENKHRIITPLYELVLQKLNNQPLDIFKYR